MKIKWLKTKQKELENKDNIPPKNLNSRHRLSYEEIIEKEFQAKQEAWENRTFVIDETKRCPFCDAVVVRYTGTDNSGNSTFCWEGCLNYCEGSNKYQKLLETEAELRKQESFIKFKLSNVKQAIAKSWKQSYGMGRICDMNEKYLESYKHDMISLNPDIDEDEWNNANNIRLSKETLDFARKVEELRKMYEVRYD